MHQSAGVISVGDELTLGQTLDTNSRWLSSRLTDLGVSVRRHVTIADDVHAIAEEIERFARDFDLVIVSGGLGPTADDLTRSAMARALGEPLVEDDAALKQVQAWFARSGREMPQANAVQAQRPESAAMIENRHGTAPGLFASVHGCDVWCVPGPPTELRPMFEAAIVPQIRCSRVVVTRVLRTAGLGESTIAERLAPLMGRDRNPLVGTTSSGGVVSCRIRYEGDDGSDGNRLVDDAATEVRRLLGSYVFGESDQSLESSIVEVLATRRKTVTIVESCTGGLLAGAITAVAGSSAVFERGLVTYSDAQKTELVAVPSWIFRRQGAVSRACVEAMAREGLDLAKSDYCLSVSGVAGPGGGSPDKPVGTVWICRAAADGSVDSRRFVFNGDRETVRRRSVMAALCMLWHRLMRSEELPLLGQAEPSD
ncbi:MAG: competence/damage-inducible protein A [Planctomycetota bacterium]